MSVNAAWELLFSRIHFGYNARVGTAGVMTGWPASRTAAHTPDGREAGESRLGVWAVKRFWDEAAAYLRAYFKSVTTLMSGILGVIAWALGAALEPMPVSLRWTFLGFGSVALVVGGFLVWRDEYRKRLALEQHPAEALGGTVDEAKKRRAELREQLGVLLMDGSGLQEACVREYKPPPATEIAEWVHRAESLVQDRLGNAYLARFRSNAGLPTPLSPVSSLRHTQAWAEVYFRIARLHQFLAEIGPG